MYRPRPVRIDDELVLILYFKVVVLKSHTFDYVIYLLKVLMSFLAMIFTLFFECCLLFFELCVIIFYLGQPYQNFCIDAHIGIIIINIC